MGEGVLRVGPPEADGLGSNPDSATGELFPETLCLSFLTCKMRMTMVMYLGCVVAERIR